MLAYADVCWGAGVMHIGCAASRRKARAVACMLVRDDAELTGNQFFFWLLSFFFSRGGMEILARDDAELTGTQFARFAISFPGLLVQEYKY
jgi:hypothetical protein